MHMNFKFKQILVITTLVLLTTQIFSQTFERIDSLGNKMCETVILITKQNDSQNKPTILDDLISQLAKKHINPFINQYPESAFDSLLMLIELRLEKNCEEYGELLYEQSKNNNDWKRHSKKPIQNIKDDDCQDFFKIENYTYLETNGYKVELEISNGFWIDHFKDGTFSKLKISHLNNCEFEIEFIESDNEIRKKFSKKGDKYKYHILDIKKGFYRLSVEIPEQSIFYTFKMYYEK